MRSVDYDGHGATDMLLRVLCETWGVNLSLLRQKIVHLCYDAVYGSSDERINRRGGFHLTDKLENKLQMQKGDITGQHDGAHCLQLVYSDVFKIEGGDYSDKNAREVIKTMWELLAYRDKERLYVREYSEEFNIPALSMKSPQETRFVNSVLSGFNTLLRNVPLLQRKAGNAHNCKEFFTNT